LIHLEYAAFFHPTIHDFRSYPYAVSGGDVVGKYEDASGRTHAFLYGPNVSPVPEPSGFMLLAVGLAALLGFRWLQHK
jgi:probable HAF family extracellular repeat protein